MKGKIAVLVFITLLISSALKAQLGVHVGCNFAKIDGIETRGLDEFSLTNFSGGLFYDKDIVSFLDLRVGVMYSPKGSCLKIEGTNYSYYYKTILSYIEVPVQVKAKAGPFYALGGVYGAYAVDCNAKSRYEPKTSGYSGYVIVPDYALNLRRIDFGLKIGAGYQYKFGPVNLFAQADYSLGLLNIDKNAQNDPEASGNSPLKNRALGLFAGVMINLF